MSKNVLLFGSRGHLARTKIIPALNKKAVNFVPISRQKVVNLEPYKKSSNIVFMSIPSQHLKENISPYIDFFIENKPLFVLEKPHGLCESNFYELANYLHENEFPVVFNDHYIAKDSILNLESYTFPKLHELRSINITLHESSCVNDRLEYFDKVGILLDMYQSHVLIVLSTLLAKIECTSRTEVLRHIAKCIPYNKNFGKYETYEGDAYTRCELTLLYKGVAIHISCGKKMSDEKSLCLQTYDGKYKCIDLSNSKNNPYEKIFTWLLNDDTSRFLTTMEISLLWKHYKLFSYKS